MDDLQQLLQDKRDWLASTTGMKRANATLTLADLERIIGALDEYKERREMVGVMPRIEPRMLGAMEPRGTKRSPEEIARLLEDAYRYAEESFRKSLQTCA
jgi:hypothetical protein